MRVSVVIPLFNRRAYIAQTIDSVLAQSFPAHEVIVVDDGSTDGSPELVATTFGDRVRLVRLPVNHGRSAARNLGWSLAEGDLVAFLDSDDLWAPENLASQVPAFTDPAVMLSHCWVGKIDANGEPLEAESRALAHEFSLALARGYDYGGITETWCRMYTSAVIVRRETLRTSGGFDTRISNFEDWDVLWRIARDGRVATCTDVLVHHRTHGGNTPMRWQHDAIPWLFVNRKHLLELSLRPMTPELARARHNLLLNMSLGEYWRRHRWAARWWMWRALLASPRPLKNPAYYMWGAPLLHAFLPRPIADALVKSWHVDPYSTDPRQVAS